MRDPISSMLKEAERASKRQHFDPSDVQRKPKRPWLDIDVGQSFTIPLHEVTRNTLQGQAWRWSNISGRVFSIRKRSDHWEIVRTD